MGAACAASIEGTAMKKTIITVAASIAGGVATWSLWYGSAVVDGMMSAKTPLYYTIHGVVAIVLGVVVGAAIVASRYMD